MSAGPALLSPLRSVPAAVAATTVLVGCMVLLGWALDVVYLKSVLPGLRPMKVNAALAFLLAGIALWLWRTDAAGLRARRLARACGLGVALVGRLTAPEQEVLRLTTDGRTNRAIAQMLGYSVRTVKDHVCRRSSGSRKSRIAPRRQSRRCGSGSLRPEGAEA